MFALAADYPAFVRGLLRHFSALPGCQVHLIGHVISDTTAVEDDYRVAKQLAAEFAGTIVAPRFANPSQAKSYIATMDFFCGSRMHACIAAFSSGVPVIPVAYSRKFAGLFGSLGYTELADCKIQAADEIVSAVVDAFDRSEALKDHVEHGRQIAEAKLRVMRPYCASAWRRRWPEAHDPNSRSLDSILASNCCSGCGLCASLSGGSVEMATTNEGYLRPRQICR